MASNLTSLISKRAPGLGRAYFVRKNVLALNTSRPALVDSEINESQMSAGFVVSTSDEDREKDIVRPDGCLQYLHEYKSNPIVCFDHEQHKVVGKSEDSAGRFTLTVNKSSIHAVCYFHDCMWEGVPIGIETFHLVRKRIFRGASPSFIPIEHRSRGRGDDAGVDYVKWRLTEWSICPLQSNQNALADEAADELRATLDRGEIKVKSFANDLRRRYLGPAPVWTNGVSMCGGVVLSGKVSETVRKGISKMADETTETPPKTETPAEESTAVPADFETMSKYLVHFEHFLNDQASRDSASNPASKEVFAKLQADVEQMMEDIKAHASSEYPDQDIEGVADGYRPEEEEAEEGEPNLDDPEAIRKHLNGTRKGLSGLFASEMARHATASANTASQLASGPKDHESHEHAYKMHNHASEAHTTAASSHKNEGNLQAAASHADSAQHHRDTAHEHSLQLWKESTSPVVSKCDMAYAVKKDMGDDDSDDDDDSDEVQKKLASDNASLDAKFDKLNELLAGIKK